MTQSAHVHVLLNPHSGHGRLRSKPLSRDEVSALFAGRASVHVCRSESEARGLAGSLARPETVVVAAGGDGTVSAVASALVESHAHLGVLPVGTLNHFAKDAGIPLDLAEAARMILQGRARPVDVAEVNGRRFLNNASLGIYAHIVHERREREGRGGGRWSAMIAAALNAVQRTPSFDLHLEAAGASVDRRTPFVFVGNNEYEIQGVTLGARNRLDAGHLGIYVPRAEHPASVAVALAKAFVGRALAGIDFDLVRAREATVSMRRRRIRVAADGEVAVMATPLRFRLLPGALSVITP